MRGSTPRPYTRTRSGSRGRTARTARGQSRGQGFRVPGSDGTPARHRPAPARVVVTVAALGKPGREVLLDATIERALARATRLVPSRYALPGPARAVHACPLVEREGSSVGGTGGRRLLAAGIGRAAEVHWLSCPAAVSDRQAPAASSTAAFYEGVCQAPLNSDVQWLNGVSSSNTVVVTSLSMISVAGACLSLTHGSSEIQGRGV
jgi:hypothetical protein